MARRRNKNLRHRYETRRLLYSGCSDQGNDRRRRIYNPDFHPADALAFFKERYDAIEDPVKYVTKSGRVGYTTKPC